MMTACRRQGSHKRKEATALPFDPSLQDLFRQSTMSGLFRNTTIERNAYLTGHAGCARESAHRAVSCRKNQDTRPSMLRSTGINVLPHSQRDRAINVPRSDESGNPYSTCEVLEVIPKSPFSSAKVVASVKATSGSPYSSGTDSWSARAVRVGFCMVNVTDGAQR